MKCPVCDEVRMREVEKNGVQIDVCPECKGVWLDRGELDKLMQGVREVRQEYNEWYEAPPSETPYPQSRDHEYNKYSPYPKYQKYPKRKKNRVLDILDDLF